MRTVFSRPVVDSLESRLLMAVQPVISEFLAANKHTNVDEDGAASDWIEIYNPNATPLTLSGYFLTDKSDNLMKWQVPAGVTVPANGYKLIWADEKNRVDPAARLHTNFSLSKDGEYLGLVQPDGTTVASDFAPSFPAQLTDDVSYGLAGTNIATPTYGRFATPTPGTANAAKVLVTEPTFSVQRGFFDAAFTLELSSPTVGATIRYSTDGSTPSATVGKIYDPAQKISITTTTVIRAVSYKSAQDTSAVVAQSYIKLADVINQPKVIPGWPGAAYVSKPFSADLSLTAKQDTEMDPAIVAGHEAEVIDGLKSIPTLSLSTDFNKWFGSNGAYDETDTQTFEQPVSIELIDPAHPDDNTNVNAAVEGQSADRMKRSLHISFKSEFGPGKWDTDLLKNGPLNGDTASGELDSLVLRAGSNRSWARGGAPTTYAEDEWVRATQVEINGGEASHGTFVHLYINGAYYGLYNVAERPDEHFQEEYNGGEADTDYFTINHGNRQAGDSSRWNYMFDTILKTDLTNSANYNLLGQYLDVKEFAQYLVLNWYSGQTDWPHNNWWAGGGTAANPTQKFKFYVWDAERGFDKNYIPSNGAFIADEFTHDSLKPPVIKLFNKMILNKNFKQLLADTAYELVANDGPLSEANSTARWNTLTDFVSKAAIDESARWGDIAVARSHTTYTVAKDWAPEVLKMRQMFIGNGQKTLDLMKGQGWYPTIAPPTFAQRGGQVTGGFQLVLNNPNAASTKLYYTLDGSDPRASDGSLSSKATLYTSPVPLSASAKVVMRVMSGSGTSAIWSVKDSAAFGINNFSNLRIVELEYAPIKGTLPAPTDADEYEFFEIQNTGTTDVNLDGVTVTTAIDPFTFTGGKILKPGEFATVAHNAAAYAVRYPSAPAPAGQYSGKLSNDGELITLLDPDGKTIQAFTWSALWYPTTGGVKNVGIGASLMIVDTHADPSTWNSAGNWRAGPINGTPGASNDGPPVNKPPVVDAGIDRTITLPTTSLTIDATVTDDGVAPGGPVTYSWTQLEGPVGADPVVFGSPNAIDTLVTLPATAGDYKLQLSATDGATTAVVNTMIVHVLPEPANQKPVVDAGPDRAITLPTKTLTLDGDVLDDSKPDGQSLTIVWSVIDGPVGGAVQFGTLGAADTTATFSLAGTYHLKLTANDTELEGEDSVTVVVAPQPVATNAITSYTLFNALTDEVIGTIANGDTINLAALPAQINVRAVEASSLVKSVKFGFDATPGTITTSYRTDSSTQFTLFSQSNGGGTFKTGSHTLRATPYTGTSAAGTAGATFEVKFTVVNVALPPTNKPPIVNAGTDRVLELPATGLSLDATVTDDGLAPGGQVDYFWEQVDGPGTVTFGDDGEVDTGVTVPAIPGVYTLRLTATDNAAAPASDTMTITVIPTVPNKAPVVNAGPDRTITLPTNTLSLDGTVNDDGKPSGQPVTIGWMLVDGPVGETVTFGTPAAADTTALFSAAGTYKLKLTAGDTELEASDEVIVTVVAKPVIANAITGFELLNAATNQVIGTITAGSTINLATLPAKINVRAVEASSTVKSVKFGFDATPGTISSSFRTDSSTQFTLFSQSSTGGGTFKTGNHTLRATPYTSTSAGGTAGTRFEVKFTVVNVASPVPPAAPGPVTATAASSTSVKVNWTDLSNNESGFEVEVSTDGVSFTPKTTTAAGAATYTVTGLLPSTAYWFRVRSTNAFGKSDYVKTLTSTTTLAAPLAPTVNGLVLINSDTDQDVLTLTDGMTITRSQFPTLKNFAVRADVNSLTNSVIFGYNGNSSFKKESGKPFALFGNTGSDYVGQAFNAGTYTLTVKPYSSSSYSGTVGATYSLTFKVV